MAMIGHPVEPREAQVQLVGADPASAQSWAFTEGTGDAQVSLGPSALGGYLNINLDPATTPIGPASAPRIAGILMFLDEQWQLALGPLAPAPEVRPH